MKNKKKIDWSTLLGLVFTGAFIAPSISFVIAEIGKGSFNYW